MYYVITDKDNHPFFKVIEKAFLKKKHIIIKEYKNYTVAHKFAMENNIHYHNILNKAIKLNEILKEKVNNV